jgi:hypothetical protein
MNDELLARFNANYVPVPESGCWLWTGDCGTRRGYGRMRVGKNKSIRAHRLAYLLMVGKIPAGLCVCHKCDTPSCVNPKHLWLGTDSENTADRVRKGRTVTTCRGRANPPRGEAHPMAKLTQEKADQIRVFLAAGNRQEDIAAHFNISSSTVSLINVGKIWSKP